MQDGLSSRYPHAPESAFAALWDEGEQPDAVHLYSGWGTTASGVPSGDES